MECIASVILRIKIINLSYAVYVILTLLSRLPGKFYLLNVAKLYNYVYGGSFAVILT